MITSWRFSLTNSHRPSLHRIPVTSFTQTLNMLSATGKLMLNKSNRCALKDYSEEGRRIRTSEFFHGKLSLWFSFLKFDFKRLNEHDEAKEKEHFKAFVVEQIMRKQLLNLNATHLNNYFASKMKVPKDYPREFECFNELNEMVIMKHKQACEVGHLAAVHAIRPHQTLVGLGGFKILFPIFEKTMESNLSTFHKADIWKYLFKILRTLMNIEPTHVQRLFRNKNLIEIIKYCLIRGGLKH